MAALIVSVGEDARSALEALDLPRQGVETIHTPRLEDLNLEPGSRQKLAALVVFDRKAAAPLASAEVLPEVPIIGLHSSPVGPGRLEGDSIFALVQPSRRELVEFFSDLDRLRRLSQSLAEAVCELLGADLGIVWQRDRRLKRFRAAGWHGTLSPELLESLPADLELADEGYEGGLPPPQGLPAPRSGADFDRAFFLPVGSLETGVDGILGGYFSEDSEPSMHQVSKARLCRHLTRQAKAQLAASDSIARSLRRREIRRLAADLSVSQAPMEHLLGLSQRMTAASSGQVFLTTFDDRLQLSVDSGEPPGPRPARESYRDLPSTATLETLSIDEQQAGFDEIIVPLKTSDARIGALQLQSEVGGFFDHHDLAAATEVTSSLLETLTPCPAHRLAASFSELSFARDLEGLAQAIVREVGELTGADTSLWMASTREGERNLAFRTVAHTAGVRPEFAATAKLPITAGSSYTAEALRRREPLWIADVQEAAAQLRFQYVEEARQRGWRSFLVFPLHGGSDEPFAALTLFSSRPSVFGPITVEQLRPLVEQANVALHEERRSEMLHYLVQTERYLNSRMADLPTGLLQDVAGLALRLTTADSVVIYPYDTIRANFYARKYIVGVGLKENWPYRNKPRLRGLAALVRRAGMIIVPDVQALAEDPSKIRIDREGVSHQELAKRILAAPFIRREGIRSFIAISLHSDSPGRPEAPQTEEVGILYINYRTPRTFSKAELETIRIYANQVTSAIRRTWLYLDAKRQADELTTLSDIASRILSRPDRREHLQALVREAADLLRASGATAYIYPADPERQKLSLVAAKGVDSDLCPIGMTVRKGEGLAGRVLESGEPLIVYDYPRWEGRIPRLANTFYSVVGVPLKREQEVVGVLAVFDTIQRRRFDKNRDVPVLERLAHLAALVLEHAQMSRLVDAFRHTTHSSLAISRPVELRELKKTIVDRAASLLIVDRDGGLGAALWRFDTERELAVIEHSTASNFEGTELHLGDGLIKLVIDKGRAAFRNDYPGWRSCPEPFRSSNKLDLLKNVIEVPITYGGKIHYVIAITSSKVDRPFNQDDADLLERFAEFASVALEKAELVLDERHLRQQADILREVSTAMVASHTLHEVGEQILAGLSRVVPYDRATVQRIDGNRRQIVAHKGFKPPRPDERFRPLSADKDIERLVQERSTHIIKNKVADWQGQVEGQRIPTWIGIPLFDGETTLGLITLSCDRPDAYSNGITDTLSLFGSHATVALQKADLFESARRRIRDLEILNTIVHDMNSLVEVTAQDLFETVVRQVAENLGCSHATIFLKRRAGGEDRLVPQATFGDEGDRIKDRSFGLDEGLAGWAFTTGQADVLDDARKDPRFADARQHQEKPRSMVVAPVMSGSSVIGVLTADQDEFAWFDEHNKRLLTAIGHHVGLIAERQDLLDELRRRRKAQIAAVTDITDAVAKAQDLQTILETILAWCMVLLRGTQLGTIRLLEPGSRRLKLEAVKIAEGTISRDDFPDMRVGEGIMGWVAKQKRPALVPDVRTDERYIRRIEGILSALAVPIRDDDEIVGVLNLEHPRRAFRKEDRNSAEAIAGLASVAYRSAILRRRIEAQQDAEIEAIKEIATAITIGEPQRHLALHSIVEKLVDLMGKEDLAVVVRLLSDDRQVLRAEAWTKDRTLPGFEIELPIDRGVTGWVAREGKTALVPNTRENVRYVSGLSEAQSELAVPMVASGQVIGVLNIESPRLGAFDERDIKFAEAIASLAVVAIDNARLYETLALRSEKLEDLYEVSTEVSSLLKLREAAKLIAESANRLLESDAATLYTFPANSSDLGPGIHVEQDGDMEVGIEPPADDEWLEGLFTLGQVGGWSSQLDQNTDPRTEGSTWVIPLLYSGERLGVLYLHYSELNDPKEEYPGIAQLFGVQAAIAIKNAREFAEARNRVKMEKWAELGKLAGSFAHRLGNKGGMIRVKTRELSGLFSDLPDMGKRIQAQEAAELIQLSTTYLLELSNLLLKPSRASRASRTPTDLKLLLNSAIRHASISKDVTIRVSLPDALPKIPANRVFRELFLEIILNAIEAMKARPKKTLEITADIDADFVFLHFEDTGIGLGPGDKQHIFKLFASGAGKSEDTGHRGFGLWWVRTFLKDIGGEISVTSSPGQGSTFTLRLPRT